MKTVLAVSGVLPNGKTFLSVCREHARFSISKMGIKAHLPNTVWEATVNHGAVVNWLGININRVIYPDYTNTLDSYDLVDPYLVKQTGIKQSAEDVLS